MISYKIKKRLSVIFRVYFSEYNYIQISENIATFVINEAVLIFQRCNKFIRCILVQSVLIFYSCKKTNLCIN